MPHPNDIEVLQSRDESISRLHFSSGQEYERAAIIHYMRQLKAGQSQDRIDLLTAMEADLLAARHHETCD